MLGTLIGSVPVPTRGGIPGSLREYGAAFEAVRVLRIDAHPAGRTVRHHRTNERGGLNSTAIGLYVLWLSQDIIASSHDTCPGPLIANRFPIRFTRYGAGPGLAPVLPAAISVGFVVESSSGGGPTPPEQLPGMWPPSSSPQRRGGTLK